MQAWFWVCDIDNYPDLWREWMARDTASLGWSPNHLRKKPQKRKKLDRNIRVVERIRPGDRIVAYLKHGRVGGIGTFRAIRHLDDESWSPITRGDHGRLAEVSWDTLPPNGMYARAPEGTIPRRLPSVQRIGRKQALRSIEKAVESRDSWAPLADSALLVKAECEELHPLILQNLDRIESRLVPGRWAESHEFPTDGIGSIDILAADSHGNPVVIEAKSYSAGDASIGQIARYMAWIQLRLQPPPSRVRGFLVAGQFTPQVLFGASAIPGLELRMYSVDPDQGIVFRRTLTKAQEEGS